MRVMSTQPALRSLLASFTAHHRESAMTTKLDKTIKREIDIDGEPYTVAISPEGVKLTQKGFRKGREMTWTQLLAAGGGPEGGSAGGGGGGGMSGGMGAGGMGSGGMGGGMGSGGGGMGASGSAGGAGSSSSSSGVGAI